MPEKETNFEVVAVNRKARADYEVLEVYEAGIALSGPEIKSIRGRHVSLGEAYAQVRDKQLWLHNCHISPYQAAGHYGQEDPRRSRKLLMRRTQIVKLGLEADRQRLTIVPLRMYIKGHVAKVEIGLARGRRRYEKRDVIEKRDADREMAREVKSRR